jgi:ABC-type glycerol-3-phosphate transport system permease component
LCAAPGRTLPLAPVIVPPLLLFLVLQRSFIQGLTIGDIRR